MPGVQLINDQTLDNIDSECIRQQFRPAEIKQDVKLMQERHRVSGILHSDVFHKALDNILDHQLKEVGVCGILSESANESYAVKSLQVLSNLLLPQVRVGCSVFNKDLKMPIIPINDLRSISGKMTKQEKFIRCKLAAVYRLIDLHGWSSGMMLYASCRIIREENNFLTNYYGIMNHEVTASNLVKVNFDGLSDSDDRFVDRVSWMIHAAIHNADPSMRCVIHLRTPSVVAVSCMRSGLLALSDEAMRLGNVPMHEWGSSGPAIHEQVALGDTLGNCSCVFVRNRGLFVRGRTVEEAWRIAGFAVHACDIQMCLATEIGSSNNLISVDARDKSPGNDQEANLHFEALMRSLDSAGYQTGYLYRHAPSILDHRTESDHSATVYEDVEIPPSASSIAGLVHSVEDNRGLKKSDVPTHWLFHSGTDYLREETEEFGSQKSRKLVSWRPVSLDKRQTSGCLEVCTSPNHFAPQGNDPCEYRRQQQMIKAKYFQNDTTAGYQSRLVRSLDSSDIVDDGRTHVVLVGAVSRGIIDKGHRQDPGVYQTSVTSNPFKEVTDDDIHRYEDRVDRLALGLSVEEDNTEATCTVLVTTVEDTMPDSEFPVACPPLEPGTGGATNADVRMVTFVDVDGRSDLLCVSGRGTMRSDTSGAYTSNDDSDLMSGQSEPKKSKKKRRLRNLFSFRKERTK